MQKKLVYVCSPLRGNEEYNQQICREYCKFVCDLGYVPFAPHIFYTQFLLEETEEERMRGINCGIEVLERCDEVWVFTDNDEGISEGMRMEINVAGKLGIPCRYLKTTITIDDPICKYI